ncbi:MAG: flagellar hook-associated protein FlgK [Sedimentisphaerales bacterium]|nr:flagellar hook-associated protein FlgK [Sedimentisphaerales bacterium]
MSDYSIGISGLNAAEQALDVIGNNIANSATEGYHRQRIELSPSLSVREGSLLFGTGVNVDGVAQVIDNLLEQEILRQYSSLGQVDRELVTLQSLESVVGEFSSEDRGLNAAIDNFFNSMQDLSTNPTDGVWQNQVVSDAEVLAGQFRTLGEYLTTLETEIQMEVDNTVDSLNSLTSQIADLNEQIQRVEVGGGTAGNLRDQRDKLISDVAALVSVETQSRDYGVVDVIIAGIPVVMGAATVELEAGLDSSGQMGISVKGEANYTTSVSGGAVGGLLALKNDLVFDIHNDLDSLAVAIIQAINELHVQGVGSAGSFTELTGWKMLSEDAADFGSGVGDGSIYVRLTDTSTGEATRHEIGIDASSDSLTSIAAAFDAITGLNATVVNSKLSITTDAGYEFDFLPAVPSGPTGSTLTGSPPTISVSGIYDGTANDTFTFTVSGTGSVGNGTLQLVVTDSSSNTVATFDVGSGYEAGEALEVGNGIKIALTTGSLNDGETFEVEAFADTDTSGVLAAVGINTFFSGNGADDMAVCSGVSSAPSRVAACLGADMTDNTNALRLAGVQDETLSSLGSLTCGEFYRQLVTNVGLEVSTRDTEQSNIELIVQNLESRRDDISGVDINKEAAELLIYEQMFQAMAKYISTIQTSMQSLMEIL